MDDARLAALRQAYADELAAITPITHAPLTAAFAAVPRERFLGPGPWSFIAGPGQPPTLTADDDPAHVYKNVLFSLDASKRLNNGDPRLWAGLFERLKPAAGELAIHVGAGTGYYSALIAEMVAPGAVTAIEFEPDLAEKARANLAAWPRVELLSGDGMALAAGPANVIVASCGVDQVPVRWVKLLDDGGRLLVPLTTTADDWAGGGWGANLLVTRRGDRYAAEFAGGVGIYHCVSGRTEAAGARLKAAFDRVRADAAANRPPRRVASLVLDGAAADAEDTWLAGDGWRLSTSPP